METIGQIEKKDHRPIFDKITKRPDLLIYVEIHDGHTFRILMDNMKVIQNGALLFLPEGFSMSEASRTQKVFIKMFIPKSRIPTYIYRGDEQGLCAGVNIDEFIKVCKTIQKKDSFRFAIFQDNPQIFYQVNKGSQNYIRMQTTEQLFDYDFMQKYSKGDDDSNAVISCSEFTKVITETISINPDRLTIHGYRNGVRFLSSNNGVRGNDVPYGNCSPSYTNAGKTIIVPPVCIDVSVDTLKGMKKIGNMCQTGTVRLTFQKDLPMRLITDIGHIGTFYLYVKDDPQTKDEVPVLYNPSDEPAYPLSNSNNTSYDYTSE